jgi:hypothetical protein
VGNITTINSLATINSFNSAVNYNMAGNCLQDNFNIMGPDLSHFYFENFIV